MGGQPYIHWAAKNLPAHFLLNEPKCWVGVSIHLPKHLVSQLDRRMHEQKISQEFWVNWYFLKEDTKTKKKILLSSVILSWVALPFFKHEATEGRPGKIKDLGKDIENGPDNSPSSHLDQQPFPWIERALVQPLITLVCLPFFTWPLSHYGGRRRWRCMGKIDETSLSPANPAHSSREQSRWQKLEFIASK